MRDNHVIGRSVQRKHMMHKEIFWVFFLVIFDISVFCGFSVYDTLRNTFDIAVSKVINYSSYNQYARGIICKYNNTQ